MESEIITIKIVEINCSKAFSKNDRCFLFKIILNYLQPTFISGKIGNELNLAYRKYANEYLEVI